VRVAIRREEDVAVARLAARALASDEGFSPARAAALATAVSEVAMNIVVHAEGAGEVRLEAVEERGRRAIVVTARDGSPGIADVAAAMADDFSTGRGLGCGLPGARRMVDEFTLVSSAGDGTVVTMKKWAHEPH
jgi:serine/threonine-protein kinase RsbT